MLSISIIFILTIALAFIFDIINGFHDAANSIATVVSTRVLSPNVAVLWAAFFNFIAIFIFAPKVADTIANIVRIESSDPHYIFIISGGLIGSIIWDLITWRLGLPTSSSHALIGGLAGAGLIFGGVGILQLDLLMITFAFIFIAPLIGFSCGALIMLINYWIFHKRSPHQVYRFFSKLQLVSAALYSIGHGANDAQKTMGVIMALLLAGGILEPGTPLSLFQYNTWWIIVSCNLAMALGTAFGGWRIVKTMGMRMTKLKPIGGFSAESAGAFSLFLATHGGIPVSTTQTITASIIGVGSISSKLSGVKWGLAARIMWAWVLTIPASGLIGAACYYALSYLFQ